MHCEPPGNQNSPSPQSFLETEGNPKSLNMPTIKPILSPREGIIRKGNTISDRITCIYGSNSISPVDPVFSPFTPQMQSTDSTSTLHKPFSKRSTTLSLMSPSPATLSVPSTSDANNRIRDNQRRSRARRAEYLQELEAKVCNYEKKGAAVSAEIQAAARRVNEENWGLRQEVERLREESRGLGGDYERLREENGVLVEENERLRRLVGRDGDREENPEREKTEEKVNKGVDGVTSARKRKRNADDGNMKRRRERRILCGFAGLKGCSGPGCEKDTIPINGKTIPRSQPTPSLSSNSVSPSSCSSSITASAVSNHHPPPLSTAYPSPPLQFTHNPATPPPPHHLQPHHPPRSPSPPSSIPPTTTNSNPPPPTPTQQEDTDTSSCHLAAHIIASMRQDVCPEMIRFELGCREEGKERQQERGDCKVGNQRLLSLMDRFA